MTTEKDLGTALKNDVDVIEIEGDLAEKVIKIRATGKIAWTACIAAIAVAIAMSLVTIGSGGVAVPVTGAFLGGSLGVAAVTWGMSTAVSATGIAIAAGGVGALNKLRKYHMRKISESKVILYKK